MKYYIILILLISFAMPTFAQETSVATGTIIGTVVNKETQKTVAGATIIVIDTKLGAISNSQGKFTIKNVRAGVQSIKVTAIGFEPYVMQNVVVSSGKPFMVSIELNEKVVQLEGAEVSSGLFQRNIETVTSTQTLSSEEIRRAPGVQEDVVRYVQLLPGVAVTGGGRNDLIVRGGAPFENLFLVDNIEVPNINHFGSQGSTGGPLSIINVDFVKDVTFSAGGFGARYGDRVSSLTNINLRNGNSERFTGEVTLSATAFGVIGEGPIGEKASYLFSVRRSYLDVLFSLLKVPIVPEYWDFQFKTSYEIDNNNSISFLGIGALNDIKVTLDDADDSLRVSRIQLPTQPQYFSGITWKSIFDEGFVLTTLGRTYTKYQTEQRDSLQVPLLTNNSEEGENSLRSELFWFPSKGSELNVGLVSKYASRLDYSLRVNGKYRKDDSGNERALAVDTSFTAFRTGLFATYSTTLLDVLRMSAGLRYDYYSFLSETSWLAPRASLTYALTPTQNLNLSLGRYYQAPSFVWLVGDNSNPTSLKPIRADQIVLGYDIQIFEDTRVQVEAYYKNYANYPARLWRTQAVLSPNGFEDLQNDIPFGLEPISSTGVGNVRGVELFIQKRLSTLPVFGLLSISYNQTRFTSLDGTERKGSFDAPIVFNIAGGWRPAQDWEISAKFRYSTGLPTTSYFSSLGRDSTERSINDPSFVNRGDARYGTLNFATYNQAERLPDFHALDVRVDKRWSFEGFQLVTYIDIQNIYGRQNVTQVAFDFRGGYEKLQRGSVGVLPSIGLNIEF